MAARSRLTIVGVFILARARMAVMPTPPFWRRAHAYSLETAAISLGDRKKVAGLDWCPVHLLVTVFSARGLAQTSISQA